MSAIELARLQFGVTAGAHFLFAALTLGLLPVLAWLHTRGGDTAVVRFWGRLYAVNYALGIVTGLVMELQFGLTWNGLAAASGAVFGTGLAAETIVAFFLESTLLALWLLGWGRLRRSTHVVLSWALVLTAYASAYFVLVANGFQQHPVGYAVRGGTAVVTDLGALLANPAALLAFGHVVGAALGTGGFFVAGIAAYRRRVDPADGEFTTSLRAGLVTAAVGSLAVVALGFASLNWLEAAQPGKWADLTGAAAVADGPPSLVGVPYLVMLVIGIVMLVVVVAVVLFGQTTTRFGGILLRTAIPLPFVAMIAGWTVREVGRQPWTIYGVLRTADAVSPVSAGAVAASLVAFTSVYAVLIVIDVRLLVGVARRGPSGAPQLALGALISSTVDDAADEDLAAVRL